MASVSVTPSNGVTIDGAAAKTVYGGDVLTLKAPRAGVITVTVNGKSQQLPVSAPDFSVNYTVPSDMTSMSISFASDLVNVAWTKASVQNGFDPVRVNGVALNTNGPSAYVPVGTAGMVEVAVSLKSATGAADETYVIYATQGSKRIEGRVTFPANSPAGTAKTVTLPEALTAGNWDMSYDALATGVVYVEWTGTADAEVYLTTDSAHLSDKLVTNEPLEPGKSLSFVIVPKTGFQIAKAPAVTSAPGTGSIVENADGSYTYTMPSTNSTKATITVYVEAVADVESAVEAATEIANTIKGVSGLSNAATEALNALQSAKTQADVDAAMGDLKEALGVNNTDTLVAPVPEKLPGQAGKPVDNNAAAAALAGGVVVASPATFPGNASGVKLFGTPDRVYRPSETSTTPAEIRALNALWWGNMTSNDANIVSTIFTAIEARANEFASVPAGTVDSFAYVCIPTGTNGSYTGDDAWVMVCKVITNNGPVYKAINWAPDIDGVSWN